MDRREPMRFGRAFTFAATACNPARLPDLPVAA